MLSLSSGISGSIHEQVGGTTGRVIGQQGEAGLTGTEGEQVGQGEQRPAGLFPLPVGLVEPAGWGVLCPRGGQAMRFQQQKPSGRASYKQCSRSLALPAGGGCFPGINRFACVSVMCVCYLFF